MVQRSRTTQTQALVEAQAAPATVMAVAEGIDRTDRRGKEDITQGDMIVPRLALAQRTSPQLDPEKPQYIEGLKLYDLFNSVTQQIYGRGPVTVAVVRHTKRAVEFSADSKVVDPNVPLTDPRLRGHEGPDGKWIKPVATLFHEYLVLQVNTREPIMLSLEPIMLSLKSTQIKVAKKLNSLLMVRPGAAWAGLYEITTGSHTTNGFTHGQYTIMPAGPSPSFLLAMAEQVYEQTKGVTVRLADEDTEGVAEPGDGDIPF